jgi:hypothetical protein
MSTADRLANTLREVPSLYSAPPNNLTITDRNKSGKRLRLQRVGGGLPHYLYSLNCR